MDDSKNIIEIMLLSDDEESSPNINEKSSKCRENTENESMSDYEMEALCVESEDSDGYSSLKLHQDLYEKSILKEAEEVEIVLDEVKKILDSDNIQLPKKNILKKESVLKEKHSKTDKSDLENKNSTLSEDKDENKEDAQDLLSNIFEARKKILKKEALSTETLQKLDNLKIKLTHVVPPQHKVEKTAGSRSLTPEEGKQFEKFSKRLKRKYTEKEDGIIKQNWKSFCQTHDWDEDFPKPFLHHKHRGKFYISDHVERKKFVQFLANGLPCRTLFSVYNRFRLLFDDHNSKGRYTPEEDKKIMLFMNNATINNHEKLSELSKILSRTHQSIFKRYSKLKKNESNGNEKEKFKTKVVWKLSLSENFLENLIKVTSSKKAKHLKYKKIPQAIWNKLKKKMGIEANVLKNYWFGKLHFQLFSPNPIYLNDIKIRLIEILYSLKLSNVKDIDWSEMLTHFEGSTVQFLCDITYRLLKQAKISLKSTDFVECINYLYQTTISRLEKSRYDICLNRVSYKKKKLIIVDNVEEIQSSDVSLNNENLLQLKSESLKNLNESKTDCTEDVTSIWTLSRREKFIKVLLKLTVSNNILELKDALIPDVVWEKMTEVFPVNPKELEKLWLNELHMQLYAPKPFDLNNLICLVELIYKKQFDSVQEIDWNEIGNYFDGFTIPFLSETFRVLFDAAVKKLETPTFFDVMKYLKETTLPKLINGKIHNLLPRLSFENEMLQVIDSDINEINETCEKEKKFEVLDKYEELYWTIPMKEEFLKWLLHLTSSERIEALKDAEFPLAVWEEMEVRLKIDKNVLQELWYTELHLQLFCSKPICIDKIKITLIDIICNSKIYHQDDIDWNKICLYFDGMTTVFLSQIFQELTDTASEMLDSKNFCAILLYLAETTYNELQNVSFDQQLPRITYNNGKIKMI